MNEPPNPIKVGADFSKEFFDPKSIAYGVIIKVL